MPNIPEIFQLMPNISENFPINAEYFPISIFPISSLLMRRFPASQSQSTLNKKDARNILFFSFFDFFFNILCFGKDVESWSCKDKTSKGIVLVGYQLVVVSTLVQGLLSTIPSDHLMLQSIFIFLFQISFQNFFGLIILCHSICIFLFQISYKNFFPSYYLASL